MKNLWNTTRASVNPTKDAETIKAHEQTIKDLERTIKVLKEENSYLKSSFEENKEELFPPAEKQRTIAEEKRDKDLAGIRAVLAHRVREKIIEKTLEGHMNVVLLVSELVCLDDESLKKYTREDIMEPICEALREEGYQVDSSVTSLGYRFEEGYFFEEGYRVSWN